MIASLKDILELKKHCLYLTHIDISQWDNSIKIGFLKSQTSPENRNPFGIKLNGCRTITIEFLGDEATMNDLIADVIACDFSDKNPKQVRIHCDIVSIFIEYEHFEYQIE